VEKNKTQRIAEEDDSILTFFIIFSTGWKTTESLIFMLLFDKMVRPVW
jgi:hypothetical protein